MEKKKFLNHRIIILFACVLLFAYCFYHIVSLFGDDIRTVVTGIDKDSTYLEVSGYIFRDEQVLYSEQNGLSDYMVDDGEKVSEGTHIATVYSESADDNTRQYLKMIDDSISLLEDALESEYTVADVPKIKEKINDSYHSIVKLLGTGEVTGLGNSITKFRSVLNSLDIVSGGEASAVKSTLDELRVIKSDILAEAGSPTLEYAKRSGYFYSSVDGYEGSFTLDTADRLDVAIFDSLSEGTISSPEDNEGAFGKFCDDTFWKFAIKINSEQSVYFEEGEIYELVFSENNDTLLPMTLERISTDEELGSAVLVFSSDRAPGGFIFNRSQSVRIEVNSISGVYVPRSAVYKKDGELGVYVLKGSVVRYRYINVIHEARDYYLVSPEAPEGDERQYLGVNEQLITNGKNLFDGRIFD